MTDAQLRDLLDGAYPAGRKGAMRWRPAHTKPPITPEQYLTTIGGGPHIITTKEAPRS